MATMRTPAAAALLCLALLSCLTMAGCTPASAEQAPTVPAPGRVPADRPVCGWEEAAAPSVTRIGSADAAVAPASVVTLHIAPELPYGDVLLALAPARHALVRVKLAVAARWLVPLTVPTLRPERPRPRDAVVKVVGRRKITRHKARPRMRLGALRVDGDQVRAYLEDDNPGGHSMPVAVLREHLATADPPLDVFTLTATASTPWRHAQAAALAAACHDRAPGEEPHEVIFD